MLSDRQQLFVFEYLKDFRPMAAAERAGYSSPPWSPEVKAAVQTELRNRKEVLAIDGTVVLHEVARMAFHDVDLDEMKPADKIKALELLGKNLALFTERVEHSVTDGLAERIAEARQRAGLVPAPEQKQLESGQ